ncbi:MAG TPA: alpha-amylase family protein [Opitutaceae bacterium]|nr:alpha-amylase family protein [Opitutaceae bacterium]
MNDEPVSRDPLPTGESRRDFLKKTAAATVILAGARLTGLAANAAAANAGPRAAVPWYRRALRWGQTNITEIDPTRYDVAWWRGQWKRTEVQGVVINAGGIVAYYPSQVPLHHRAEFLGNRDLFGELAQAAHADGLAVFARMDSNSAHEDLYRAHPDWFAVDAGGRPYRNRELYVSCVNSGYYDEHIPAILREIATRYQPEGFTDNSWSGLGRGSICYCANCERKFRERSGQPIPRTRDWNSPVYREWIRWNYARRLEIWDTNSRISRDAGGPDCLWVGMNGGNLAGQAEQFRDFKAICERAELIMLDDQRRENDTGFQRNGEVGKTVHGLLGWDKVMPESIAMYQTTSPTFRLTAKPEPEVRLWMLEAFAGGIQPWWHHVGAYQEDRRQFRTPEATLRWHRAHEEFLINRRPVATVGVLWSQGNIDFFGRDEANLLTTAPANGFMQALVRARIPYLPVHLDHLDRDGAQLRTVILPNIGAMSDEHIAAVRRFGARGGGLLATGHSSLGNEWGDPRDDYALADLFGAHLPAGHGARTEATRRRWASQSDHTYLRLTPSLAAGLPGPHAPGEPPAGGKRHPALRGFDETDILPFGGTLEALTIDPAAQVLATFIPSFPAFPPELSWMRQPKTDIPALIVNEKPGGGRVAFLPADLDRRYARENLRDHADLLANLVRWTARDDIPLVVEGPGLVDCHLYRQADRIILHLVNLTNAGTWRAPVEELIPVGPLQVRVKLPEGVRGRSLQTLVSTDRVGLSTENGWGRFELRSVLDHEVVVIQ